MFKSVISLIAASALLASCASTPTDSDLVAVRDAYCGRFFIYDMCAVDFTENGTVDAVYFEDTSEVFLYREEAVAVVQKHRPLHICAQVIDNELGYIADKLLTIQDDTGYFTVAGIKSDLMLNYMRYTGRVNRCNKEKGLMKDSYENQEDDFHDFDYDEYETDSEEF